MPSILYKFGNKLKFGAIPNPIEWLIISDDRYEKFQGTVDSERVFQAMNGVLKFSSRGRLSIFWNGFHSVSTSCFPE